jgi:hypothetical protein
MQDRYEKIPLEIESLIGRKAFEELAGDERQKALDYISADEYEQFHFAMQESRDWFGSQTAVTPSPSLEEKLLRYMDKPARPAFRWSDLITFLFYRIPVYQVAVSSAAIVALFVFVSRIRVQQNTDGRIAQASDTLYKQQPAGSASPLLAVDSGDITKQGDTASGTKAKINARPPAGNGNRPEDTLSCLPPNSLEEDQPAWKWSSFDAFPDLNQNEEKTVSDFYSCPTTADAYSDFKA